MTDGRGRSSGGFGLTREQNAELLVETALAAGVTNHRQIAYILATAQHETRNFDAPEEDFGRQQAKGLNYGGGENYFGRGYVHLTHKENYQKFDRHLGLDGRLMSDLDLAKSPEIAAQITVIGMRDGLFTGKKLGDYIGESPDYYNARRIVNGVRAEQPWSIDAANHCATYAKEWETRVPELMRSIQSRVPMAPPMEGAVNPSFPSFGTTAPHVDSGRDAAHVLTIRDLQDASHPLHNDFAKIQSGVAVMDADAKKPRDAQSANMEASLLGLAVRSGIRADWAMLGITTEHVQAGKNVFVGEGEPTVQPRRWVHMETQTAINTPAEDSFRQVATLQAERAQAAQLAPVQSQDATLETQSKSRTV